MSRHELDGYADKRIALQIAVLNWLDSLLPVQVRPVILSAVRRIAEGSSQPL